MFRTVFTPWRWTYIKSTERKSSCVLCAYLDGYDPDLLVYVGDYCFIVMNKYPYSLGHIMIVPRRHVPSITDLTTEELHECAKLLKAVVNVLPGVINNDKLYIGINIGRVAGAGIEEHMHIHVVPEPQGDNSNLDVEFVSRETVRIASELRRRLQAVLLKNPGGRSL
ncbi:HIT family protein [Vulcanisaeta thermophila]|uniref:HIT family protein n=1 Tax=Vulcanisaeta thermophila TaxID=867917 RepID=UPI00085347A0|nr:HIT domain-containing protein [Vulcanisaeta thermophila]